MNRVLPELFGRAEEEVFDRLRAPDGGRRRSPRRRRARRATQVLDAAELAVSLRRRRAEHLEPLRDALPRPLPMLFVPELFARTPACGPRRRWPRRSAEELG